MTAALDTNVLLYASDESSPFHARALDLVRTFATGPDLVYLFWPVVMGYLRLATHPSVFERPLPVAVAMTNVDDLLTRPHVRAPGEADRFWDVYARVAEGTPPRANLVPDAHLVALMRQHGVPTIWSHDRDFRKFDGITVRDPFA